MGDGIRIVEPKLKGNDDEKPPFGGQSASGFRHNAKSASIDKKTSNKQPRNNKPAQGKGKRNNRSDRTEQKLDKLANLLMQ